MKELLHLEQNDEFPDFFNGIILNLPDTNAISIIDFDLNINTYMNLKVSYPFYFGFIPRTFIDNYPLFFQQPGYPLPMLMDLNMYNLVLFYFH